jgi:hypothetical protein
MVATQLLNDLWNEALIARGSPSFFVEFGGDLRVAGFLVQTS